MLRYFEAYPSVASLIREGTTSCAGYVGQNYKVKPDERKGARVGKANGAIKVFNKYARHSALVDMHSQYMMN